jgi:pimeloyl-ACP methyl ester carboxylesterase
MSLAQLLFVFIIAVFALSANAAQDATQCVDRLAAPDGSASEFDRIPNARYSCLRLANDRYVLVAEAGVPNSPAVLLVHGMGNNAHRDWRASFPELAKRFHVIALDLPGFGASQALPDHYSFAQLDTVLVELAARLQLVKFHLVGHSLGADISLNFAQLHPQLVERLVLVDIAGVLLKPVFVRQLLQANTAAAGMGSLDSVLGIFGAESDNVLDLLDEQYDLSRQVLDNPLVQNMLIDSEFHADAALGLLEHDFTTALRTVRMPTTVIWGRDDPVTPLRTGTLLAARMPNARLEIIDGAEHMPMNQRPAAFNEVLLRALSAAPMAKPTEAALPSHGSVNCLNQPNMRYTGTYERISLINCTNARIEHARAKEIDVQQSGVTLENVIVESDAVALRVTDSTVTATAATFSGSVAVRADASRLDLAGVTLRGKRQGVEKVRPSRVYFSVSEYHAPDFDGDAHRAW